MACSLPVIVSRNAGCAEDLVKHGQNGFVFDPEDASELARCLGRFDDDQVARAMGRLSAEMIRGLDCRKFAQSARQAIQAAMPNGG